jgi:hypothetical protein
MLSDRNGSASSPQGWTTEERAHAIGQLDNIAQRLQSLMEVADDNGHTLLAYLINMAEVEARYVADEQRKHLKN